MSDTDDFQPPSAPSLASEDNLPPVQPPGAGFIFQLFLIPMMIVGIIVTVWVLFSWLAHMGSRPEEMVRDFERLNDGTWQKALTLANLLRDRGNAKVRRDEQLATRLSDILAKQIQQGATDADHIRFRMYLCRALGEFEIATGLPTLLQAASVERSQAELKVRRAALESIARLIKQAGVDEVASNDSIMSVLHEATATRRDGADRAQREACGKLRSRAAFVLGLLPGDSARELLTTLLGDPYPFARYNAAVGLARHGDIRAIPRLEEMLSPAIEDLEIYEDDPSGVAWSRNEIIKNGLRAVRRLATVNSQAELGPLIQRIEGLLDGQVEGGVEYEARDVLFSLRKQTPAR